MNTYSSQRRSKRQIGPVLGVVLLTLLLSVLDGRGAPTTADQAMNAVTGWLKTDQSPLQTTLGQQVKTVQTFGDAKGITLYYVVYLNPEGFVIVAGDDLIEPIVGFAPRGEFDPSTDNPLGALVSSDLPSRLTAVQALAGAKTQSMFSAAKDKWGQLESLAQKATVTENALPNISDVRVTPLIQTLWDQTKTASGYACYNYYTPPYASGNANNYPCGCVATAMAQLMRFWQYPVNGVGTDSFTITVDGVAQSRNLRGGNGTGGSYVWSDMVLNPTSSSTLAQRQAIGALCADAGVSVHMSYSNAASGGSSAYMEYVPGALTNKFYYTRAVCGGNAYYSIGAGLNGMVNPNLDSGFPVIFGITGTEGHAVVCDGYGYNVGTLYHHLNLGWGTFTPWYNTAWYNLPTIDAGGNNFNSVSACVYNVWTNGTGEIISGRVLDSGGNPVAGVAVSATRSGGGTYTATSDAHGIFALARIPSLSTYSVSASNAGHSSATQTISTGLSTDGSPTSGNKWGVLITVNGPPSIVAQPQSQAVTSGDSVAFSVTASGTPPLNYQWFFNGQPIRAATGSSYSIAEVQTNQAGAYTVGVSNSYGSVLSAPATLVVYPPEPTITTQPQSQTVIAGTPATFSVTARGVAPLDYQWLLNGQPINTATDYSYSIARVQSSQAGTYTVVVSNSYGMVLSAPATLSTSSASAFGIIGVPFRYYILANNNPTSYSASALPTGLSCNGTTGLISGTPTRIEAVLVTVQARNRYGSTVTATIPMTIAAAAITSAVNAPGVIGVPFSYQIGADNTPTAYLASSLPPGLHYDVGSGVISGSPTKTGTFSVNVQAKNLYGTASTNITLTISGGAIISATSAPGVIGVPFGYQIAADNNPTAYSASGLPAGLRCDTGSGAISGTPTQIGTFSVNVQARNLYGTASATISLTISGGAIISPTTALGVIGVPLSYQIVADNNPTAYSASGLPTGLRCDTGSGLILGTPTQIGTFQVNVQARNLRGTASATLSLTISDGTIGGGAQPTLTVSQTGNSLAFTWPVAAGGYVLEEAQVLSSTWTNSSVTIIIQGNTNLATIAPTGTTKFYRLRK